MENVCERMQNYAESTDKETGRKSYIRTSSRNGEAVKLENISMSGDIAKTLKFAVSKNNSHFVCYCLNPFTMFNLNWQVDICEKSSCHTRYCLHFSLNSRIQHD